MKQRPTSKVKSFKEHSRFHLALKPILEVSIYVLLMIVKLKGSHLREHFEYPELSRLLPYGFGHEVIKLQCPEALLLGCLMVLHIMSPEMTRNLFSVYIPSGK